MPGVWAKPRRGKIFGGVGREAEACGANPVAPITHDFIANTLRSMRAAFDHGAEVVELDVHLTRDGVFAVFHDWRLECQIDGVGVTRVQDFAPLQGLDLGYGYTSDGVNFPLRGHGVGQMPRLGEVFAADLGGTYLINFKSRDAAEGVALAARPADPGHRAQVFGIYGGDAGLAGL